MANSMDYVRSFKRNCPNVRMTKDEADELYRLFTVCRNERATEELKRQCDYYRSLVVWGFHEEEKPIYTQGKEGEHEICEPITAEEVNALIDRIKMADDKIKELTGKDMDYVT